MIFANNGQDFNKYLRGQVWMIMDETAPQNVPGIMNPKRPYLILAVDFFNAPKITAVPINTRDTDSIPTHVSFVSNDGKKVILRCEEIDTFSDKWFDAQGCFYMYTIREDLMRKVNKAIAHHLHLSLVDESLSSIEKLEAAVDRIMASYDINKKDSVDTRKVVEILTKRISAVCEAAKELSKEEIIEPPTVIAIKKEPVEKVKKEVVTAPPTNKKVALTNQICFTERFGVDPTSLESVESFIALCTKLRPEGLIKRFNLNNKKDAYNAKHRAVLIRRELLIKRSE